MEKIQCEACGSNDLVYEGGYYVCRYCGTKFAVTEKNRSVTLQNLYLIARRAVKNGDRTAAKSAYAEILREDPVNWEPTFYSACYSDNAALLSRSLGDVLELVKKREEADETKRIVREIADGILTLPRRKTRFFSELSAIDAFYEMGEKIENAFGKDPAVCRPVGEIWKEAMMNDPREAKAAEFLDRCAGYSDNAAAIRAEKPEIDSLLEEKNSVTRSLGAVSSLERGLILLGVAAIVALILDLIFSWSLGAVLLIAIAALFFLYTVAEGIVARGLRKRAAALRTNVFRKIAELAKLL